MPQAFIHEDCTPQLHPAYKIIFFTSQAKSLEMEKNKGHLAR